MQLQENWMPEELLRVLQSRHRMLAAMQMLAMHERARQKSRSRGAEKAPRKGPEKAQETELPIRFLLQKV